jgi:hypothetical protein
VSTKVHHYVRSEPYEASPHPHNTSICVKSILILHCHSIRLGLPGDIFRSCFPGNSIHLFKQTHSSAHMIHIHPTVLIISGFTTVALPVIKSFKVNIYKWLRCLGDVKYALNLVENNWNYLNRSSMSLSAGS